LRLLSLSAMNGKIPPQFRKQGGALASKLLSLFFLSTLQLCLLAAPAVAEDYSGKYQGDNLAVQIAADGDAYSGKIQLGQQEFPLKAREDGDHLQGTFNSGGHDFDFTATRQGDALNLISGGVTYNLKKNSPPANPLADAPAAPANPLTAAPPPADKPAAPPQQAPTADGPAGYTIVNATDAGKAMSAQKPDADSVQAALESAFADLAQYFGSKLAIKNGFVDSRDRKSGGASFASNFNGQDIKGFVSCKLGDKGATVAVIYCRADATPDQWSKLSSASAGKGGGGGGGGAANDLTAAAAQVPLQPYQFPDGSGSIGIAQGWQTNAQSCMGGFQINGPADQMIYIGVSFSVVTPDSLAVRNRMQMEASARQLGSRLPPMQMLVAPFTGPGQALVNLVPQISQISQSQGGPAVAVDHVQEVKQMPPIVPRAQTAIIFMGITRVTNGQRRHYRAMVEASSVPVLQQSWYLTTTQLSAPDATYERDLPAMVAMTNSMRTNDSVIQQKTAQNIQASNQRFAAQQRSEKELTDAYDSYNKDMERNSVIQSRSNDNFDEIIRGYRTVEDTQTGEKTSVDLGNVDGIVDNLNKADPGRYVQIPLRDEADPLPPK
jgi:hypothetical protein